MKKLISSVLVLCMCILSLCACGKEKEKEIVIKYYMDTHVPTFTCITEIEKDSIQENMPVNGIDMYTYKGCTQEDMDKYTNYLKTNLSFVELEANDDYPFFTLEAEEQNVIIDYSKLEEGIINITPYIN